MTLTENELLLLYALADERRRTDAVFGRQVDAWRIRQALDVARAIGAAAGVNQCDVCDVADLEDPSTLCREHLVDYVVDGVEVRWRLLLIERWHAEGKAA